MCSAAVAYRSRASTTLRRLPALMAATASATACSHCGAGRLPSCHLTLLSGSGTVTGSGPDGWPGPVTVVSQAWPRPSRPSTACGTISTDPSDEASKVNVTERDRT